MIRGAAMRTAIMAVSQGLRAPRPPRAERPARRRRPLAFALALAPAGWRLTSIMLGPLPGSFHAPTLSQSPQRETNRQHHHRRHGIQIDAVHRFGLYLNLLESARDLRFHSEPVGQRLGEARNPDTTAG